MSKKTKWSVAGVFAAVIVGVIVLTAMRSGTKAVSVRIEPVQRRDLIASVTASGNVTPHTKVDLSSDITGKIDLRDRKSTRLNSSHRCISYAVFCLKKKRKIKGVKQISNQLRRYSHVRTTHNPM